MKSLEVQNPAQNRIIILIDETVNNKPRKRSKQRISMIAKLHQEQVEIAKWSGKAVPQMSVEAENDNG